MITKIISIPDINIQQTEIVLQQAGVVLREGGLVVFPTETVYGLGGNALDKDAAAKIYSAKGRPSDNPLIVHVARPEDAELYAYTGELYYQLARAFMPGPLTVIMPVKQAIPRTVTAGLDTVAIRCPAHPVAHALLICAGVPIAAPSANLSGSPSPTCARHVIDDMNGRVDMILDGGDSAIGVESTIVKIEDDDTLTLLRPGGITVEMLREITPHVRIADAVLGVLPEGATVLSPCMKYRHYSPKAALYLVDGRPEQVARYAVERESKTAIICYEENLAFYTDYFGADRCFSIGNRDDEYTQAHRLFTLLREIDKLQFDEIYAPLPKTDGIGMALYNRMIRAAAHHIIHF